VRFDDVHWNNFGREEALLAGRLIERWLGERIWSRRRIMVAFSLFIAFLLIGYIAGILLNNLYLTSTLFGFGEEYFFYMLTHTVPAIFITFFGFSSSISLTKFITFRTATLCGVNKIGNAFIFFTILILNYFTLTITVPILELLKGFVIYYPNPVAAIKLTELFGSFGNFHDAITLIKSIDLYPRWVLSEITGIMVPEDFAFFAMAVSPPIFRFILSIIFMGSFLLRPLIMHPVNFVWRRIVESDKPVFALIFGGIGAFASALGEAAKHL
jgi:hypothetical protein